MKTIVVIAVMLIAVGSSGVSAENIYSLIKKGQLKEATDSLSRIATAATRDGNTLFFQSLIEPDAANAARMMETALNSSVAVSYRQEVYYRLAQYYLINSDVENLSRVVNEYRMHWETGKYEQQMHRFSIFIDEIEGDYQSALKQADRYHVRFGKGEASQWGRIDRARILKADGKAIGAQKLLRELSREKKGIGIPQALYLLAVDAVERKRTEDAVFYYNLLREGYPMSIGLDVLVDRISGISQGYDEGDQAERITGTFYSVKVGVFSVKGNAKKQANLFKGYDQKVEIKDKNISGKKYHVVYVGRFSAYRDAYQLRITLENAHNEVYQVVPR